MSLADKIFTCFKGAERFTLKEAYEKYSDKPAETIRERVYIARSNQRMKSVSF